MEIGKSQGFYGYIYFDPTDEELIEVAKRGFDTLRMGIHTENGKDYLVFGDGNGTTHSTVSRAMGELNPWLKASYLGGLKYQGINGGCLILYEEHGKYFINGDSWSLSETEKPENIARFMKNPAQRQFKELIRLLYEQENL